MSLVGREEELARARAIAGRALFGEGGMVVVQGEAGIGKSRLTKLTAADEKRIAALVKRAVS